MEEKRMGPISSVGLPGQPMRSMPLERHVILCVEISLCSTRLFARKEVVSRVAKKLYKVLPGVDSRQHATVARFFSRSFFSVSIRKRLEFLLLVL